MGLLEGIRSYQERARQLKANRKVAWKRNLPKEQEYWKLRSLLRKYHVIDKDTDNYEEEHRSLMRRLLAWAKRGCSLRG